MKAINARGPKTFGGSPPIPALPAKAFRTAVESGAHTLLDTRDLLRFGGGHIHGALSIAARPELSVWAAQLVEFDQSWLLVLENDSDLERVVNLLWRTGHTDFAGYLAGGMTAWETAGFPFDDLPQISVHELRRNGGHIQLLDVRTPSEWEKGRIPGAQHLLVAILCRRADRRSGLVHNAPVG